MIYSNYRPYNHITPRVKDFGLEVALGNIPGYSKVNKFGQATDCDSGIPTDVWDGADGTTRFRDLRSTHGSFVRRNRWVIPVDESCSFEVQLQDGDELLLGCAEPPARLCLSITACAGNVSRRPDTEALEQTAARPEPVD